MNNFKLTVMWVHYFYLIRCLGSEEPNPKCSITRVCFNYIINVKLLNQETMIVDRSTDISDKDLGLNPLY